MKTLTLFAGVFFAVAFFFPSTLRAGNGPSCDGVFHWVYVGGTENLDGSETGFEYLCQTGSARGPLLFYLDGGGACWDGDKCDCQPDSLGLCTNPNSTIGRSFFNLSTSEDGLPWAQTYFGGAFDPLEGGGPENPAAAFVGPTSPFNQNWNIIRLPYTTGDLFAGDKVQELKTSAGRTYAAHFRGYRNITNDLAKIQSLFPSPSKIAIWGASAGGAGADCNLSQFRSAWSATSMYELSNAVPALGTANLMPLIPALFQIWGAWAFAPSGAIVENTCPIIPASGSTDWNLEWVVRYNAHNVKSVRKALTDDYSDAVVDGFACLTGATPDATGSCKAAVRGTLTDEFKDVISSATNYKVYYHTGACHFEREHDGNASVGGDPGCDFDNMIQGDIHFRDWVNAWINNRAGWVNVK